jgi:hypothetical protein
MSFAGAALSAAAGAVAVTWGALRLRHRVRRRTLASATIVDPRDATTVDPSGAVRSVQAADLTMAADELEAIWSPLHLERLARTYWRYLSRCTLGLIRVAYTPAERFVVLLARPLVLLSFCAPEYEMDERRGVVRWRIRSGVLVSRRGRGGDGYLQIDVQRRPSEQAGTATIRVEVEVANFYPAIASRFGKWLYTATQSRIHVLVTHGFLRSLARLDLAPSKVGRFATPDEGPAIADVPDPPPPEESASAREPARQG